MGFESRKGGIDLSHAGTEMPQVSENWRTASDAERERLVTEALARRFSASWVRLLHAQANGHVLLGLVNPMRASSRGPLLLRVERMLKDDIDGGLEVYLSPLQDRNMLRRLRGMRVKET